jgi:hypothetical protein
MGLNHVPGEPNWIELLTTDNRSRTPVSRCVAR